MNRVAFAWLLFFISEVFAALTLLNLYHFDARIWSIEGVNKESWHMHVLIMGGCMIILNGHGMVVFRLLPRCRTLFLKFIHLLIHTGIFCGAAYAIFIAHKFMDKHEHPYFLHTFMGFCTMLLYFIQYLLSIFVYLYLYSNQRRRKLFASYHNFLGVVILQFSIATACVQLQDLTYEVNYDDYHGFYAMANMVMYGLSVNSIVLNPYLEWRLVGPL